MKSFRFLLLFVLTLGLTSFSSFAENTNPQNDLELRGIIDLDLSGYTGKAIHLVANADISDLSHYGIGVANNGDGTDGREYDFPNTAVHAGDHILVARSATAMQQYLPYCFVTFDHVLDASGIFNFNGDDAIELFDGPNVMETFGDVNEDGSGTAWEYLDSWAYKVNGTWTYGAVNCTDGSTTTYDSNCPYPLCSPSETASLFGSPLGVDDHTFTIIDGPADSPSDRWGNNLSAPYPTNTWWIDLTIPDDYGSYGRVNCFPYQFQAAENGLAFWLPTIIHDDRVVNSSWDSNWKFTATETGLSHKIIEYDELSVGVEFTNGSSHNMYIPLVRGMAYASSQYNGFTPELHCSHAILSITGEGGTAVSEGTSFAGQNFTVTLNNGQTWKLYSSAPINWNWSGSHLTSADAASNVWVRMAILKSTAQPSSWPTEYYTGQNEAAAETLLNDHSEAIPVSGSIDAAADGDVATVQFLWSQANASSQELLMYALPHQQNILSESSNNDLRVRTIRGIMKAVVADTWTMTEPLNTIGWTAPRSIPDSRKPAITEALKLSETFEANSPSIYFGGKQLQGLARLVLIADELGLETEKLEFKNQLQTDLGKWFQNQVSYPFRYDQEWGGIIPDGNPGSHISFMVDFYNDHHFQYGHFIYAAAVLAKEDPTWVAQNGDMVMQLIRNIANPSESDPLYTFMRNKDWFVGHSLAAGIGHRDGDGRNQESTSEAVNAWYAVSLYGLAINDTRLYNLGRVMLATELRSSHDYWQMRTADDIYPPTFEDYKVVGRLWDAKADHNTWFGDRTEFIHGIHYLPITPFSESLLRPDWITEQYPVVATALDAPDIGESWKGLIYAAHGTIDPSEAWSETMSLSGFDEGNPPANALYWAATRPNLPDETLATPASAATVAFSVDLSNEASVSNPQAMIFVNGAWTAHALADSDNDETYTVDVDLPAGQYAYKFQNNGIWESLSGESVCTVQAGEYVNRQLNVTLENHFSAETISLPTVCWDSCSECSDDSVTFHVDISDESYSGAPLVYMVGDFQASPWDLSTAPQLNSEGNGVYSVTLNFNVGEEIEYKFLIGSYDYAESLTPGSSCTLTTGEFTNRVHTIQAGPVIMNSVCFGSCEACPETGCMDSTACNYDDNATVSDDSCVFVEDVCDVCNGDGSVTAPDSDADGVCNALDNCSDTSAFNYNDSTNEACQTPDDCGGYPCLNVELLDVESLDNLGGGDNGNECWGWTDPISGREIAIFGRSNGTSFIDVTSPTEMKYFANLPTQTGPSMWRDIKVNNGFAYIVSEASGHGMQVVDLHALLELPLDEVTVLEPDAFYSGFGNAHNIMINEETDYAYAIGTNTFSGGMHIMDISSPLNPVLVGAYDGAYSHDIQPVVYNGPDQNYVGREIVFCFNGAEGFAIVDVEDKGDTELISQVSYNNLGYTTQGWVSEDHRLCFFSDELDEMNFGHNTRTYIMDIADLDAPELIGYFEAPVESNDHNLYVIGDKIYQSNYLSGLRILDNTSAASGVMELVGYFDTNPESDAPSSDGTWSNYPYFASGNIAVSTKSHFFMLQPSPNIAPTVESGDSTADCNDSSCLYNNEPVADNQSVSANEDTDKSITLTGSDVENSALTYTVVESPQNGSLSGSGSTRTYSPNANFNGTDSFTFRVNDGDLDSQDAVVTINVISANDEPVADNQSVSANEDTDKSITLTGSDVENSALTYTVVESPQNGSLSGSGSTRTYSPNANFNGTDSFTFRVNDGDLDSQDAVVTINVISANDEPVADNQSVSANEDTDKSITLTGSDVENSALTYTVVESPQNGSLSGSGSTRTYSPNANFNGTDSFTFRVNDGDLDSQDAVVTINVISANDEPVADNQSVSANEDTDKSITLTGSDVENSALTYTVVESPQNGSLSGSGSTRTYSPNANFNGTDSFTFRVNDGDLDSQDAVVTINVISANDEPVADNQSVSANEDTDKSITLTGSDVENSALTYTVVESPQNGSLSGSGSTRTYSPNANFNGTDSFTFRVNDGDLDSQDAVVTINVISANDEPVADNQSVSANEDTDKSITLTGSDVENSALTYTVVESPQNGSLSGSGSTRTYSPNANFNGTDSFTFRVNDGDLDSQDAVVTINVISVNDIASFTIDAVSDSDVAENVAYTSAAANLSGDTPIGTITYSLSGADAADFTVNTSTGVVSMVERDFENPEDSDTNNTYEYTLVATDSDNNAASDNVVVTVTNVVETGIQGCTDSLACNYDSLAIEDDGSCLLPDGCTEEGACNYDPTATCDDSSCLQDDACGNCGGSGVLNENGECIELYTVADFIRAQITGENNLHMSPEFQAALSLLQELNANNETPNAMDFLQGHSSGNELFMEFSLQAVVDSLNGILLMEEPIE